MPGAIGPRAHSPAQRGGADRGGEAVGAEKQEPTPSAGRAAEQQAPVPAGDEVEPSTSPTTPRQGRGAQRLLHGPRAAPPGWGRRAGSWLRDRGRNPPAPVGRDRPLRGRPRARPAPSSAWLTSRPRRKARQSRPPPPRHRPGSPPQASRASSPPPNAFIQGRQPQGTGAAGRPGARREIRLRKAARSAIFGGALMLSEARERISCATFVLKRTAARVNERALRPAGPYLTMPRPGTGAGGLCGLCPGDRPRAAADGHRLADAVRQPEIGIDGRRGPSPRWPSRSSRPIS